MFSVRKPKRIHVLLSFYAFTFVLAFQNCADFSRNGEEARGINLALSSPPDIVILKSPSKVSATTSSEVQFSSSMAGAQFMCSFDNSTFALCTSPQVYSNLADGNHSFSVYSISPKNVKSDQMQYAWTVDRAAPTVTITTNLPMYIKDANTSIAFTASVAGGLIGSYECKVDANAAVPCTSPFAVNGLTEAQHTVQVVARDTGGKPSAPASITFRVDLTAPTVTFTTVPAAASYTTIYDYTPLTFNFTVQEVGGSGLKSVMCKLDSGTAAACTNTVTYSVLPDGTPHTVSVITLDNVGNTRTVNYNFTLYFDSGPFDPGGGSNTN